MGRSRGHVFSMLLIWFFAGCLVALGLKELYRRHHAKDGVVTTADVQALRDELQGDVVIGRASLDPKKSINENDEMVTPKRAPLTFKEIMKRLLPETGQRPSQ